MGTCGISRGLPSSPSPCMNTSWPWQPRFAVFCPGRRLMPVRDRREIEFDRGLSACLAAHRRCSISSSATPPATTRIHRAIPRISVSAGNEPCCSHMCCGSLPNTKTAARGSLAMNCACRSLLAWLQRRRRPMRALLPHEKSTECM